MKLIALLLIGAIISNPYPQSSGSKQKASSFLPGPVEVYRKVLDLVFPRGEGDFKDRMKEATLILRYKPSFGPETQIQITKYKDQRIAEAVVWTVPKDNRSIWEQVNAALNKDGNRPHIAIAQAIKVERRLVNDPDKLSTLLQHFASLNIPSQLDSSVTLDGYRFELWYETVSNNYYFCLTSDREDESSQPHPLIKWMVGVKSEMSK